MHANSLKSWAVFPEGTRRNQVISVLQDHGRPMTDREIVYALGSREMNYARPAITSLVHDGVLVEHGDTACTHTGRTVRTVRIATDAERNAAAGVDRRSYSDRWTMMCEWAGLDRDATKPEDVVRTITAARNAANEIKRLVGSSPLFTSPMAHVLNVVLLPNILEGMKNEKDTTK